MTPDPIPQARESAVEMRPLPSRDELARMLDARAFADAQHPHDESMIIQTDRVRAAYETADQLLAYFGLDKTALATPPCDDVAELRAQNTGSVRVTPSHGNTGGPEVNQGAATPASGSLAEALQREIDAQITICAERDAYLKALTAAEAQRDALQERVRVLEEALGPFAMIAPHVEVTGFRDGEVVHRQQTSDGSYMTLLRKDFRRAQAALPPHQQGNGGEDHGG